MMDFATPALVQRTYPNQLKNLLSVAPEADVTENEKLIWACTQANHEVEMYLAGGMQLPLPESADSYPALQSHAVSIAWWFLLQDRPETLTESDRANVKDARKFLSDLATGKASLGLPPSAKVRTGARSGLVFVPTNDSPWEAY